MLAVRRLGETPITRSRNLRAAGKRNGACRLVLEQSTLGGYGGRPTAHATECATAFQGTARPTASQTSREHAAAEMGSV